MADWLRDTLGLSEIMRFENAVFFECGSVRLYLSAGDPAANSLLYFHVADIHTQAETFRAAGATIASALHLIHVHEDGTEERKAFINDPEGGNLGLMTSIPSDKGN